jgi:hypothetical protein
MLTYVPLTRLYDGRMIDAFLDDHEAWKHSPDVGRTFVKARHDYVYELGVSAISAMATWALLSAAQNSAVDITAAGATLWADVLGWRAKQASPPLEPAPPAPTKTAVVQVLRGQLCLF